MSAIFSGWLFGLFVTSIAINLFYWLFGFSALKNYTPQKSNYGEEGISIIICNRNGLEHLQHNLHTVLHQSYPKFEVIVVDDDSDDESLQWLYEMQLKHKHLSIIAVKDTLPGKKMALKAGITAARYQWLLLTDVDCQPASSDWATQMMNNRKAQSKIVLGYSPYNRKKGWLNALIRYETLITAIQYLSATIRGMPYMGVGRNVLYHKEILSDFDRIVQYDITSGDDDLLINALAKSTNCSICIAPTAFTYSQPKENLHEWLLQKTRHISTGYHYRPSHQWMLFFYGASQAGLLLFFGLIFSNYASWATCIYLFRWVCIMWSQRSILSTLRAIDLWKYIPLLDMCMSLYFLFIHPLGLCMKWGQKGHFITGMK